MTDYTYGLIALTEFNLMDIYYYRYSVHTALIDSYSLFNNYLTFVLNLFEIKEPKETTDNEIQNEIIKIFPFNTRIYINTFNKKLLTLFKHYLNCQKLVKFIYDNKSKLHKELQQKDEEYLINYTVNINTIAADTKAMLIDSTNKTTFVKTIYTLNGKLFSEKSSSLKILENGIAYQPKIHNLLLQ